MNCTRDGAVVERVKTTILLCQILLLVGHFWPAGRLLPTTALGLQVPPLEEGYVMSVLGFVSCSRFHVFYFGI